MIVIRTYDPSRPLGQRTSEFHVGCGWRVTMHLQDLAAGYIRDNVGFTFLRAGTDGSHRGLAVDGGIIVSLHSREDGHVTDTVAG